MAVVKIRHRSRIPEAWNTKRKDKYNNIDAKLRDLMFYKLIDLLLLTWHNYVWIITMQA